MSVEILEVKTLGIIITVHWDWGRKENGRVNRDLLI